MSLVLDDDDYPPYPEVPVPGHIALRTREEQLDDLLRQHRKNAFVAILCGLVAGVAIGGLLVAYGVF